jgi:ABC-type transport system involved in multi-copper enzyme maturation permease subunit
MVGSVLYQEMLLGTRRSRWHWFRWIYAAWSVLLTGLGLFFYLLWARRGMFWEGDFMDLSGYSQWLVGFLTWQHFLLLTLLTPVLVAGAVTDEKSRGTLQYLLTADLLSWEILVGKLVGRVYQGVLLMAIAFPIFCGFGVFAGLDVFTFLGLFGASLVLILSLGSMSLLASVWCRSTRDAVLALYCVLGIMYLIVQFLPDYLGMWTFIPAWVTNFVSNINPLYPLGKDWTTVSWEVRRERLITFSSVWGGVGLVSFLIAAKTLRWKYLRQMENAGKKKKEHWWTVHRPPVKDSPLTWKERFVEGVAPLALLRKLPTWLGVTLVAVLTAAACCVILAYHLPPRYQPPARVGQMILECDWESLRDVILSLQWQCGYAFYTQGWVVILLTALVIGIRCSGAVTGEREKNTWEALLLTPLENAQLIRGKLWGIAGASVPYLIAYAIPAVLLSLVAGPDALFWTILWLGVNVLAIFYVGAAGLWCSVRSKSSWRSLLSTLAFTYLGGFVLLCVLSAAAGLLMFFVVIIILMVSAILERYNLAPPGSGAGGVATATQWGTAYNISLCLVAAGAFALLSWLLLRSAEYRVGILERIKHWKNEPRRPFLRRRRPAAYDDWD